MNINRTKLDNIDEDIEVINLKLDNTLIKKLLSYCISFKIVLIIFSTF